MLKKLLGLLMVAILNIMPNTIFAAEAPVGDGQEEVYGGGGTAGATDNLVEEDPCAICFGQLQGRRTMREHLKELVEGLKDLLAIKVGTPEPEDEDNRTVALHPVAKTQATQHRFHRNCIRRWLQDRHNCPLCNEIIDNAGRLRLGLERLTQEQEELNTPEYNLMKIGEAYIGIIGIIILLRCFFLLEELYMGLQLGL